MADTKITALTALTGADPANDVIPIVDVSDTTMAASGTTKKISVNNILGASGTATLASATITGNLTLSAGTANGVGYLNGSKVFTAGSALVFDGTNLGVGGTGQLRFATSGGAIGDNTIGTENSFSMMLRCGRGSTSNIELASDKLVFGVAATERMRIDSSGNVGIGVTPSAWSSSYKAIQIGTVGSLSSGSSGTFGATFASNMYQAAGGTTYIANGYASRYDVRTDTGNHVWYTSASGTAGNVISFTQAMTLDASGNLGIGVTPSAWGGGIKGLQIGSLGGSSIIGYSNACEIGSNFYFDTGYKYGATAASSQIQFTNGEIRFKNAASGTAGNAITYSQPMTLDGSGNLILQPPSSPPTLGTNGQLTVNATSNTNLRFSYRGSDGVTRVANITLA